MRNPLLFRHSFVPVDEILDVTELMPLEAPILDQSYRSEPVLGHTFVAFDMHVHRFGAFVRVEEYAVWTFSGYGWHIRKGY